MAAGDLSSALLLKSHVHMQLALPGGQDPLKSHVRMELAVPGDQEEDDRDGSERTKFCRLFVVTVKIIATFDLSVFFPTFKLL